MNCTKCGRPLDPGAVFCGNCGQAVSPQAVSPVPAGAPNQNNAPAQNQSNNTSPAYAIPAAINKKAETKVIIGLIVGILSVPAALIPIAGFILGIAGLILSTTSYKNYKHAMTIVAVVFSSIGILLSILAFAYNVTHLAGTSVATKCFTTSINNNDSSPTVDSDKCTMSSTGINKFLVDSDQIAGVDEATAQPAFSTALQESASTNNLTITSKGNTTFHGAPAYYVSGTASNGESGYLLMAYKPESNGKNVLVLTRSAQNSKISNLGIMDSKWNWK